MAVYTNTAQATGIEQEIYGAVVPYVGSKAPTHEDTDVKGGYMCVSTTTTRNAIPASHREAGMKVFVQSEEIEYTLESNLVTWTSAVVVPPLTSVPYTYRKLTSSSGYDIMNEYKWSDGKLELFIRFIGILTPTQTGASGMRYGITPTVSYPTRFLSTPITTVGVHDTANGLTWGGVNHASTSSCSMIMHGSSSWSRGVGYLSLTGRWK